MRLKMKKEQKAFTLVELLVVISIIAILLSILMPALGKVRKQAQGVICLTNARSLGQAAMTYANDNEGLYPRDMTYQNGVATCKAPYWDDRLFPYVGKNYATFLCPAVMNTPEAQKSLAYVKAHPGVNSDPTVACGGQGGMNVKCYRINSYLGGDKMDPPMAGFIGTGRPWSISNIRQPSAVIAFVDSDVQYFSYRWSNGLRVFTDLFPRHNIELLEPKAFVGSYRASTGSSGFSFADGHSGLISWEFSPKTAGKPPKPDLRIYPGNPADLPRGY